MANACLEHGEKEKGLEILRNQVRNHHEDEELLSQVQEVFVTAGLDAEGREIIDAAIKEVVELNNTGTQLVRAGKLEEALGFFEKAVENFPDNCTINMNIANVLLMHMKANGKNDNYLYRARQYLERVHKLDPKNENYRKLITTYEKLTVS